MSQSASREKYAIEIKDPSRHMTFTYLVSLALIALLSIVAHLFLDSVIDQKSQTIDLIDISGQQRMLSQRASLFTLDYLLTGSLDSQSIATNAQDSLHDNHSFLLAGHYENIKLGKQTSLSTELYALYFKSPHKIDSQLREFANQISNALSLDPLNIEKNAFKSSVNFIDYSRKSLLKSFDDALRQYQLESNNKINSLRFSKNIVLGIILFTIFFEAFFVFRPMVANTSDFARRIQHEANYDMLTGVLNRRAFDLLALQNFSESQRYKSALSVMMCDIDFFKKVNDTRGHTAGDLAIQKVAHALQNGIRRSDILARFGGEEFIFILPQTPFSNAVTLGEKLRKIVEAVVIEYNSESFSVTASFGISELRPEDGDLDTIVARADVALYRAKAAGRNCVDTQPT